MAMNSPSDPAGMALNTSHVPGDFDRWPSARHCHAAASACSAQDAPGHAEAAEGVRSALVGRC